MKIYVATDLSACGRAAIDLAGIWAAKLQAELVLVHFVHDPVLGPALSDDVPGGVLRARSELARIAEALAVPCQVVVRTAENVADAIVATAADGDFLFVGSQGKSMFERFRLGSVATKVLRHSSVPVVCCPAVPRD